MLQRCTFLSARSILMQTRCFASESKNAKLIEAQKKYRTSASEVLSLVPHTGANLNKENTKKMGLAFAKYYEEIGAQIQYELKCKKISASRYEEESYNYFNSKIENHSLPFYSLTHFPLLSEFSGNRVVTEESFLNNFADFMNVSAKERPMFDDAIIHSDVLPNDEWALDLQKEFHDNLDTLEDSHQDAIDAIERDFGTDNQKCDIRGFASIFEQRTNPGLLELEKKYMMTPEEIEEYNYFEAMSEELKDTKIEPVSPIPDLDD